MNNFILEDYIEDMSICDDLIVYHKNSSNKTPGTVNSGDEKLITVPNYKISTDVSLSSACEIGNKYIIQLHNVVKAYIKKYPHCVAAQRWSVCENISIQYYKPNEGFLAYHFERGSNSIPETYRHLVFMTYLNDVDDEGETEFLYQNIKVKPKKGKTLIWPADWTHTHRGVTSLTQEKYIITGWFSYF